MIKWILTTTILLLFITISIFPSEGMLLNNYVLQNNREMLLSNINEKFFFDNNRNELGGTIRNHLFPNFIYQTVDLNGKYGIVAESNKYNNSLEYGEKFVKNRGELSSKDFYFHGGSNKSIYIVSVSSQSEIFVENVTGRFDYIDKKNTSGGGNYEGIYLTNGTNCYLLSGSFSADNDYVGNLRYLQLRFDNFNYVHENRSLFNYNESYGDSRLSCVNLSLPSGTWHFIFTGGFFDLSQDDILLNISVWLNCSGASDLKVTAREGGTVYILWFGEFDANVLISKAFTFELMLNGKYTFHINNTFIYDFVTFPTRQGFMRVKWATPNGKSRMNMLIVRDRVIFNGHKYNVIFEGIGPSGEYKLSTSYLNYVPILFRNRLEMPYACPVYFIGLDVSLT